jgi:hypothetical protein
MLARVTDQQDPIVRSETGEKLAHLVRARKARFVHKVEVLVLRKCRGFRPGKEPLQRSSLHARLPKLPRRT